MRRASSFLDRLRGAISRLLALTDDLLFPDRVRCLCCSAAVDESAQDGLCPACCEALEELSARQEQLDALHTEPLPPGIDFISAAFPYEQGAKRLIRRLKFEHVRAAAVPLARAMARLPGGEEELIVPMPTTGERLKKRGFNQAELIGRQLGGVLGMPFADALSRGDNRAAQSSLSARERRRNLVGCMRADARVRGKRILLVDDVCTTGSSAEEAARALLEAGAEGVGVFVAARSVPRRAREKAKNGRKNTLFG